jgi:hypothetical protein
MSFSLLAFSLSTTFTKIGAIAAFAALLGIAVLSLLVFSQAREIKRLREWAGRAPERAADMEQKVTEAATARAQQQTPVAQTVRPAPRTEPIHARPVAAAAVPGPATRVVGEPVPAATPGQTALPASPLPVTAAGTPAAPVAAPPASVGQPLAPGTPASTPANPVAPGTPPAPATAAGATQAAQPPGADTNAPVPAGPKSIPWQQQPAPTGAKPGAVAASPQIPPAAATPNGADTSADPSKPAPVTAAAAGAASAARAPVSPVASPQPSAPTPPRRPAPPSEEIVAKRVQARSGVTGAPVARAQPAPELTAPARSARERSRVASGGSSRRMIGLIVAVVVVVVLVVVLLGKGGSSPTKSAGSTSAQTTTGTTGTKTHHKAKPAGKATNPADTTVSVLNGTETTGLARRVSTSLQTKGYSQAAAQFGSPPGTHEVTVVEYAGGHQTDAEGVARALSLSHVQPMEQAVAALAGAAKVVVIVGADEATKAP